MNPTQIQYVVGGAIAGYVVGAVAGHFIHKPYMHHIGAFCAVVGAFAGYNYAPVMASMPAVSMPAAVAPVATPAVAGA